MSENVRSQFGGAKVGYSREYENLKLVENVSLVVRVLPAMHSCRDSGAWAVFHKQHFGYKGTSKDKSRLVDRPFHCPEEQDFKTKMIVVSCPECRNVAEKTKMRDDLLAQKTQALKAKGVLEDFRINQALKEDPEVAELNKWLYDHNLDFKHYINVVTLDGKLGLLRIPGKAKKKLETEIQLLRSKGIEPISDLDKGVYFELLRTGNGNTWDCKVNVYMETSDGGMSFRIKPAPLSDEILDKALKNLPDLNKVSTVISASQIKLLVESSGSPDEVDTIFGMSARTNSGPTQSASLLPAITQAPRPSPRPLPPSPPVVAVAPQAPVPVVAQVDLETQMRARLEAEMATRMAQMRAEMEAQLKAASAPAVQAPKAVAQAPVTAGLPAGFDPMDPNVSPEDFAKAFKLPPR